MNPSVEFLSGAIVTKTRGFLELLTCGAWRRQCVVDFARGVLEEKTFRLSKISVRTHDLREFDAVDYSYELLASHSDNGIEHEFEEYRVGLRFASTGSVFTVAAFRGSVETPYGLAASLISIFPRSWTIPTVKHEVEARSLANMLCQKLELELAL